MIHDAGAFDTPESYSLLFRTWYRGLHMALPRVGARLVTVSEFSRGRIAANLRIDPARIGTTVAGNCTQASFDSLFFARHIGLYAGMPDDRSAHGVQRLCTTGFEAIAQGARATSQGQVEAALCVGTENMSRSPVASSRESTIQRYEARSAAGPR